MSCLSPSVRGWRLTSAMLMIEYTDWSGVYW